MRRGNDCEGGSSVEIDAGTASTVVAKFLRSEEEAKRKAVDRSAASPLKLMPGKGESAVVKPQAQVRLMSTVSGMVKKSGLILSRVVAGMG